jgi:hypothetical protein
MKYKTRNILSAVALIVLTVLFSYEINAQNPIIQTNYTADPAHMRYTMFILCFEAEKATCSILTGGSLQKNNRIHYLYKPYCIIK